MKATVSYFSKQKEIYYFFLCNVLRVGLERRVGRRLRKGGSWGKKPLWKRGSFVC
jgi:hypothetical protein